MTGPGSSQESEKVVAIGVGTPTKESSAETAAAAEEKVEAGRLTPEELLTEEELKLPMADVVAKIKAYVKEEEGSLHASGGDLRLALRLLPLIAPSEARKLLGRSAEIDVQYLNGKGIMSRQKRDVEISLLKRSVLRAIENVPEYLMRKPQEKTELPEPPRPYISKI